MKQTNERAIIRLLHAPTADYIDWYLSESSVPSVHYINERAFQMRTKLDKYLDENNLDLDKEGVTGKLTTEQLRNIGEMNSKIIKLKIDAISCILEPAAGIPEGYESKRELLEQCISGMDVIPAIMDFFSKHSNSTTALPEHSPRPIHILDRNGKPWESEITKQLAAEKRSTD